MPDEWREALQNDEQALPVDPEAWPTVQLWLRVQTQWRTSMGGFVGLDYPAVFAVMDRARIEDNDGQLFEGLQVMEFAVLNTLNKD